MSSQNRYDQLVAWAQEVMPQSPTKIELLSGDASFRRYFRAYTDKGPSILVDADPTHENTPLFVKIANALCAAEIRAPQVQAVNYEQGFMLQDDLGDYVLLGQLNNNNVKHLYSMAIDELLKIQQCQCDVRSYDDALLRRELSLFHEWFLPRVPAIRINARLESMLEQLYQKLIESALQQPKVFVHLDYHSRNLMSLPNNRLGVVDFQDATIGPITYDLVSLLRDCYIAWPQELVDQFVQQYLDKTELNIDKETFTRWFDWMGLQRHLKCVGIFTRLNFRDSKPGYMADIPRVLNYILMVTAKYPEFAEFNAFLIDNAVVQQS